MILRRTTGTENDPRTSGREFRVSLVCPDGTGNRDVELRVGLTEPFEKTMGKIVVAH